jgi:hypothetical protein
MHEMLYYNVPFSVLQPFFQVNHLQTLHMTHSSNLHTRSIKIKSRSRKVFEIIRTLVELVVVIDTK